MIGARAWKGAANKLTNLTFADAGDGAMKFRSKRAQSMLEKQYGNSTITRAEAERAGRIQRNTLAGGIGLFAATRGGSSGSKGKITPHSSGGTTGF